MKKEEKKSEKSNLRKKSKMSKNTILSRMEKNSFLNFLRENGKSFYAKPHKPRPDKIKP